MRRLPGLVLVCCLLASFLSFAAVATAAEEPAAPAAAAAPASTFQTDLVADADGAFEHLLQLAEASPPTSTAGGPPRACAASARC